MKTVLNQRFIDNNKMMRALRAWEKDKRAYMTVENPNKNETNRPFIKVSMDEAYGKRKDYKFVKHREILND